MILQLAATLPIPDGTEFVSNSTLPAGVLASTDGIHFAAVPLTRKTLLADGKLVEKPIPYGEYRVLRWPSQDLPAGKSLQVVARARLSTELAKRAAHRNPYEILAASTLAMPRRFVRIGVCGRGGTRSRHGHRQPGDRDLPGFHRYQTHCSIQPRANDCFPGEIIHPDRQRRQDGHAGQTVYFPHTITNTGNGTDTYALGTLVAGGTVTQTGLTYYVDANGDGVPDNFTPITSSPQLGAGDQFNFVVAATIPASATAGTTGTVSVPVSDTGSNSASNTDTTTVQASVLNVTNALSVNSGASPSFAAITVTLSYSNAGTAAATNLIITDVLPSGMTYVASSGRWSGSGSTAMTDAAGGDPAGINYDAATTPGTIVATIASVVAGTSGTVTFQVNVNSGLTPTTPSNQAATTNTATFRTDQQTTATSTNSAVYRVLQAATVSANGQTVASAAQGATVSFSNVITNNGSGTDSFDVTYPVVGASGNNFPTGTTFALYQSDGTTTLLDSNGNGTPDTGPVAPGASFTVILKATLPTNATGGPFAVTKTATSKFDPTKTATATDTLTAITNNTST